MEGAVAQQRDREVVRAFWDATRARDAEGAAALLCQDVEWTPAASERPLLGREAVTAYFETLAESGLLADAQVLELGSICDDVVLVAGAMRVRRSDGWLTTLERWWLYELRDGLVHRARSVDSRAKVDVLLGERAQRAST